MKFIQAKKFKETEEHFSECEKRWTTLLNRDINSPDYQEEWHQKQCKNCRFYIPLSDGFKKAFGVCSNENSQFDGLVRYHLDGCDCFEEDDEIESTYKD